MADCPTRYILAQWIGGELPVEQIALIQQHLAQCVSCNKIYEELRANVATYEAKSGQQLARLRQRLAEEGPRPRARWKLPMMVFGMGIPAALAALLLLTVSGPWISSPNSIRYKGQLTINIVAKRGPLQLFVKPGQRLHPGDALRFVITTSERGYLSVFSIDARRTVSYFYPETAPTQNPAPWPLKTKGRQELPGSVVLDDTLGPEYFFVIFSPKAFDRSVLLRRIQQRIGHTPADQLAAKDIGFDGELFVFVTQKVNPSPH